MSTQALSPSALRKRGLKALEKSLGPVGAARFLQLFEEGSGDYTKDRKRFLTEKSVAEVVANIRQGGNK